jgi:phosphate:Na+ symporter
MGGVALLLWGMHMVQSGILRAYGADLRRVLNAGLRSRWQAFAAGLGVTAVLQSSTATAMMATSFAASGMVELSPALAIMLGANVGSTLIVQLLSFDIGWLSPLLLVIGVAAFKRGSRTRTRDIGRVMIGLGLMILALHLLRTSIATAETAPAMRALFAAIIDAPLIDLLVAAALAWAAHSSIAVVLLAMSLASGHVVTPVAALALVLGANLGSALNPLLEGAHADNPANRRLPMGNLVTRLVGCALALPFLAPIVAGLARLEPDVARQAADFHTLFNVVLAALFILPLAPFARMLRRLLPAAAASTDPGAPAYLDAAAMQTPSVALTCAARETLHMGDIVDAMLRQSMTALLTDDRKLVSEVERMDNAVDKLHEAIKLYVTEVTREALDAGDGRRAMEIIAFAINLEHIGDIVEMNLMELAAKKIRNKLKFSKEGAAELEAFHRRVVDNLKLALGIFISGDAKIARQLLHEKVLVREAERVASESHFGRLRQGRVESIETSSLHLDILRDLKRIHSHICSVAYPVLEAAGELQPSRLKAVRAALPAHDLPGEAPPSPAH